MTQIYANNFTTLVLGRRGENLARKVVFDIRDLESLYGTGDVEVIYQRPCDAQPYPLTVHRNGTLVTWDVTATDTEMSDGSGKCELRYYVGETLAKSKIWRTWVEPSMGTPSETTPPEPEQGWVDQIIAVGAAAKASADAAKADADRAAALAAQAAEKAAQTAQDASDAAKAMEAAQTAQRLAEEAQGAAETARTAAETAQAAAEQSATDAAGAKQGAETAMQAAQEAAAAAANALEAIRTLYQEMQIWAQGVIQDVNAAGSAAVQSVQTAGDAQVQRVTDEGETQTANAKAQADAAAQSASGAAQSAQEAAESAAVYDNVVADVNQLKQDIGDLKSALEQSNNELFRVSGYLNQNYVKGRQRYVDAGVEKFANNNRWISPAQGEYIELKSGDMIVTHQPRYHFRICYSTDNKATWTMTGEQPARFTMPSDAIAWIPIIATTTATDEDVETILNEHVIEIIRNGVNLVGSANANVNGVMDALNINPNSGFQIEAIKDGTTFNYVNTTAAEIGGTEKLFEVPCAKDDVFRIKFNFQAMVMPENFTDYYLIVREINEDESSPLRNVIYKLSELQTAADFTVYYANTKKIIANVNLKRSDTTVLLGYHEEITYAITVIKVLEQNDVYTEAGEAWEV